MMERSSTFSSHSAWAGIIAGLLACVGATIAYTFFDFYPTELFGSEITSENFWGVIWTALFTLLLAFLSTIAFSFKKAKVLGEKLWNPTTRRLLIEISFPLISGGLLLLILLSHEMIGIVLPLSLIFYGLALVNAGNFTQSEVKLMGAVQIILGLLSLILFQFSLLIWTLGFGVVHIIYGIHMYHKYEP